MLVNAPSYVLPNFGPCRVLCAVSAATAVRTVEDLLLAGCDAWLAPISDDLPSHPRLLVQEQKQKFDVLLIEEMPFGSIVEVIKKLAEVFGGFQGLVLVAPHQNRALVEPGLFHIGWRRHPGDLPVSAYAKFDDHRMHSPAVYEMVPKAARERWTVESLQADRPLHMDMMRESGCRADAHIVRYSWAAGFVRPGDTVLDCACGLGYGSYVLASRSRAARVIGVDLTEDAIDYATENYGGENLEFRVGDASALDAIPDHSVDIIVSMETLEHVPQWLDMLDAFQRVLKPDGRLVCSVPNDWSDETGEDPNPYHYHVFDWSKLAEGLGQHFILEKKFIQTAPGGVKLASGPRVLQQVPFDDNVDSEWLLAVASANPFNATVEQCKGFRHPQFDPALRNSGAPVVDFGKFYDNPYLYRPLVQMGERIDNSDVLVRMATLVVDQSTPGSADQGAALCVLGYRLLEGRIISQVANVLSLISDYMAVSSPNNGNPHVGRWRLSLAFLAGRLAQMRGDFDVAIHWFQAAQSEDWRPFSSLLATKAIGACFYEGVLHLEARRDEVARQCFARGVCQGRLALQRCGLDSVGTDNEPIPFGFQEMAEVADMASQCANALASFELLARDRGLFWRQIDVRRFGVATWAKDVELINSQLIGILASLGVH